MPMNPAIPWAFRRLNYFDLQYLQAADFSDQQSFHIGQAQRLNALLRVSGIAEGLVVTLAAGAGDTLCVAPGTAIDAYGNQVLMPPATLLNPPTVDATGQTIPGVGTAAVPAPTLATGTPPIPWIWNEADAVWQYRFQAFPGAGTVVNLLLVFKEAGTAGPTSQNTTASEFTRLQQTLTIDLSTAFAPPPANAVVLATLTVNAGRNGFTSLSLANRQYTGICLPDDQGANTSALYHDATFHGPRLKGQAGVQLGTSTNVFTPILTVTAAGVGVAGGLLAGGNAKISGLLTAANGLTVSAGTLTAGAGLAVTGSTSLGGAVTMRSDVAGGVGPLLALNNFGASADAGAAIDFNGYDVGSNAATARLRSQDDGNFSSHLVFYTKNPGAVTNPLTERLRLSSGGGLSVTGGLTVSGPTVTGGLAVSGPTALGDLTLSGDLRLTGNRQIVKVFTKTMVVSNKADDSDSPAGWEVTYSGFKEVYSAFIVFQGFSLWGNSSTRFDHWDHSKETGNIPQHAFVRIDGEPTTTSVKGVCFCSESNQPSQGDNSVLFTVVVIGVASLP